MEYEFTHGDLRKIFPWIKSRTLIYWVERGLFKPDITEASGRGTTRKYSYKNLIEIAKNKKIIHTSIKTEIKNKNMAVNTCIEM